MRVIAANNLAIIDQSNEEYYFNPDEWVAEMDSTMIALESGSQKLQGVSVWKIVSSTINQQAPNSVTIRSEAETLSFFWADLSENDNIRIFSLIEEDRISFVLADMSGEVYLTDVSEIIIE